MIVGVDVSSRRIDLAWLENNRPQRWHQDLAKGHLIDRLRSIRVEWPQKYPVDRYEIGETTPTGYKLQHTGTEPGFDVSDIAIEYPYAPQRSAIAALMATTGVITRQAPPWARVAWPSAGELRAAIGARNQKADAHEAVHMWACRVREEPRGCDLIGWDEHELDALVACIGWTRILEQQDAA